MKKPIQEIVIDPRCPICKGSGSTRNPLSCPRIWRKLERIAFKLISQRPNIEKYPRAWRRLLKLRRISGRYQDTNACPRCAKRRLATTEDVAKRLGIGKGHPHFGVIQRLEGRGLLSWTFPDSSITLYTLEKYFVGFDIKR